MKEKKEITKINHVLLKSFSCSFLAFLIGVILILIVWTILSYTTDPFMVPNPLMTIETLFMVLGEQKTYLAVGYTFFRIFISIIISSLLAIFFGLISGMFNFIEKINRPVIIFLRAIPLAAIVLVILLFTKYTTYFVVVLLTFPIIFESTLKGVKDSLHEYDGLIKLDGNLTVKNVFKLILPLSSSSIFLGIVQCFSLSLKAEIMAEIMVGSSSKSLGLGNLINTYYLSIDMNYVFAYTLLSIIIISIFDYILLYLKKYVTIEK